MPPTRYSHRRARSGRGEAARCLSTARVASNVRSWCNRVTVAPLKRVTLVQGRWRDEAFGMLEDGCQSERVGIRDRSSLEIVSGMVSERRSWPDQDAFAIAKAASSRGPPLDQEAWSARIMSGLIGFLGSFLCFSLGQARRSAFLMRRACGGCLKGSPAARCQAARADRLPFARSGPVRPKPSASQRQTI